MNSFGSIVLDGGISFFSCERMIAAGAAVVECEKIDGFMSLAASTRIIVLNRQAWALMQTPVEGQA